MPLATGPGSPQLMTERKGRRYMDSTVCPELHRPPVASISRLIGFITFYLNCNSLCFLTCFYPPRLPVDLVLLLNFLRDGLSLLPRSTSLLHFICLPPSWAPSPKPLSDSVTPNELRRHTQQTCPCTALHLHGSRLPSPFTFYAFSQILYRGTQLWAHQHRCYSQGYLQLFHIKLAEHLQGFFNSSTIFSY